MVHDLAAVEVGADGLQLLGRLQLGDAPDEVVHAPGQHLGLALVAGRAVTAGQLDESVQLVAGVPHEAAHGGVGPAGAGAVAVEAQVQAHQPGDDLDVLVRVAQRRHPVLGHPGPDHLVVVEHHAVGARRSGSWACRRRGTARPGAPAGPARCWPPPRSCGPARPCGGGWGPAPGASASSSGRNSSARPVSTRNHRPSDGSSTTMSLSSSSRTRSAETMARRSPMSATARTSSSDGPRR